MKDIILILGAMAIFMWGIIEVSKIVLTCVKCF